MTVTARAIHHASLLVIPHPANDHRPFALRHKPLAFLSTLLIAAKVMAVLIIGLTPASADLSTITSARILQLTNQERTKKGLGPLTSNSKLAQAAQKKGEDMLAHEYFAHVSPSGVTPWFWMAQQKYTYQIAGENLAIDFTEAEDVVTAWMNSPTHKENMLLPDYTETGIAVVAGQFEGGTSTIVVHMFGKPQGVAAAAKVVSTPTPTPAVTAAITSTPAPTKVPAITPVAAISTAPLISPSPTPTPLPAPAAVTLPPEEPTSYIISPQTDAEILVTTKGKTIGKLLTLSQSKALIPIFTQSEDTNTLRAPSRLLQLTRRMLMSSIIAISCLLLIAIFVRIRVQHPALIAHAAFVILLAAGLLFH